ncbi:MAG: hypothetical protein M1816_002813 [Peltula sp. TS41687]|nr:MAG: hypothetical protein M1816_002813 [Peltula sp. TS41687]
MPLRLTLLRPARPLPIRSLRSRVTILHPSQQFRSRQISGTSRKLSEEEPPIPHVSEEAAKTAEITGEEGPDIGQGTPVTEILKQEPDMKEKAPEVLKEEIDSLISSTQASMMAETDDDIEAENSRGYKFDLPELPLPSNAHLKHRYAPILEQVTNLMMRDGKKSVAQRNMSLILSHLRTSPPPSVTRPLLPGAPPPSHLPLHPIMYLTVAIDSVAPLLRIRSQRGAAGGGASLQIPVPLRVRQRRRKAMEWILEAASKRKSRGSGQGQFAQRVAEELIAVVEGRSGVWERRTAVHKLGISARANIGFGTLGFRRGR